MPDLTVDDPILSLYAAEAGNLSIAKICNAMGCCNRNIIGMQTQIFNLPSVYVNGGEDIIEDIREGNSTYAFILC
jgi:hypothetical protein